MSDIFRYLESEDLLMFQRIGELHNCACQISSINNPNRNFFEIVTLPKAGAHCEEVESGAPELEPARAESESDTTVARNPKIHACESEVEG